MPTPTHTQELERICLESPRCTRRLAPGMALFPDRREDRSDHQWSSFRRNLPLLLTALVLWCLISSLASLVLSYFVADKERRVRLKGVLYALASIVTLAALHRNGAVWLLLLAACNYFVARSLAGTRYLVPATWLFALGTMFLVHHKNEYFSLGWLIPSLSAFDEYAQVMRWHTMYNLMVLRLISFNLDHHWSLDDRGDARTDRDTASLSSPSAVFLKLSSTSSSSSPTSSPPSSSGSSSSSSSSSSDSVLPLPLPRSSPLESLKLSHSQSYSEFARTPITRDFFASPLFYLVYVFYIPLYFAGPIISSNAFMAQFSFSFRRIPFRDVLLYAARLLAMFLFFEWTLHYIYTFAVVYSGAWFEARPEPYYVLLFGYTAVHSMWFKFYIIWRFFRLWCLSDNIECIENMPGCVDLNGSVRGFWSIWHCSFNRWLIRYLYVPLGGNKRYALAVFATFTFTAVWHDLELHLLLWGWLMALIIVPEALVSMYFSQRRFGSLHAGPYWRHLVAFSMALNAILIISLNLLGFSVGTGVADDLVWAFYNRKGLYYLAWTLLFLTSGYQLVVEYRRVWPKKKKQ
eukprot:TRINITY_DN1847_c0_g1_i1.p1 TRINITY_DN1847_c0_g1~~TRINITY_DN1847_c0_g1_i1.p1  ORF type:complete len:575 (-),score=123.15 TRINITY_DN1847_c0_g1_i1:98-1822(-)